MTSNVCFKCDKNTCFGNRSGCCVILTKRYTLGACPFRKTMTQFTGDRLKAQERLVLLGKTELLRHYKEDYCDT